MGLTVGAGDAEWLHHDLAVHDAAEVLGYGAAVDGLRGAGPLDLSLSGGGCAGLLLGVSLLLLLLLLWGSELEGSGVLPELDTRHCCLALPEAVGSAFLVYLQEMWRG